MTGQGVYRSIKLTGANVGAFHREGYQHPVWKWLFKTNRILSIEHFIHNDIFLEVGPIPVVIVTH